MYGQTDKNINNRIEVFKNKTTEVTPRTVRNIFGNKFSKRGMS